MSKLWSFVKSWWHYLIGFGIFAYLLSQINIRATVAAISSANPALIAAGFLLVIPMFVVKAMRWKYMMAQQGIRYSLRDSISMYFAAMYIGFITPGRVAELLKSAYLIRDGHSFGKSFFSVFFDRLADLLFLAALGYAGLFFFRGLFQNQLIWLSLVAVAEAVIAFALIAKKDFTKSMLQRLLRKVVPQKHKDSMHAHVEDFYTSLKTFNIRTLSVITFYTALSYVFFFAMAILLAESLGIHISYVLLGVSMSIAALVTIVPVSVAGVGTRDATLLLMLGSLGVASETIIAYSTLNLLATLFLIAVCAPFWFRKPIKF